MSTDPAGRDPAVDYSYWFEALEGRFGDIQETDPRSGFYRVGRGPGSDPVAIWRDAGGFLHVLRGHREVHAEACGETWVLCAKHPVSKDEYDAKMATGSWLSDPPEDVPVVAPGPDPTAPPPVAAAGPGPAPIGHNSGDPSAFEELRIDICSDIAEARSYYHRHPIKTKEDADRCENWRQRIYAKRKRFDEMRMAERRPLQEQLDAIQLRYKPILDQAEAYAKQGGELDGLSQAWARKERARILQEQEEAARTEMERRRAAAEQERRRAAEERAKLPESLQGPAPEPEPIPEITAPVIAAPKVMMGTGATRRGIREEAPTATITDLEAAALHLAKTRHPKLIELVQNIANAAARSKARVPMPGCLMSWERPDGRAA